eukprot:6536367-Pyramimonas_sp.AAC.1
MSADRFHSRSKTASAPVMNVVDGMLSKTRCAGFPPASAIRARIPATLKKRQSPRPPKSMLEMSVGGGE